MQRLSFADQSSGRGLTSHRDVRRGEDLWVVPIDPDVVIDQDLIDEIELLQTDVTARRIEHAEPLPRAERAFRHIGASVSAR